MNIVIITNGYSSVGIRQHSINLFQLKLNRTGYRCELQLPIQTKSRYDKFFLLRMNLPTNAFSCAGEKIKCVGLCLETGGSEDASNAQHLLGGRKGG